MLCTRCGELVRPVVAIDLDGTLGEYHEHFVDFAEGYLGYELPHHWPGQPADWEQYLGLDRRTYRDIKLAYRQGGMKRVMPVYQYATELCVAVRGAGAELWITTTRPYNRLDSVDPDTQSWLERHSIAYDHLLYDDNKYQRLAELVDAERVVMVLDDLAEQCRVAQEQFGWAKVVMRYNTHNIYDYHQFNGVANLEQATKVAMENIGRWYETYG